MPFSSPPSPHHSRLVALALEQHEAGLLAYVSSVLRGDLERAREVVQDAMLKLCLCEPSKVEGHLKSWLYAVCRNRALDILRKDQRLELGNELVLDSAHCPQPDPAQAVSRQEWHGELWRWVEELRPNQREVIKLKFLHDCSYRQIAEITGLTVGNVGFIMHHAMAALRERLQREDSFTP